MTVAAKTSLAVATSFPGLENLQGPHLSDAANVPQITLDAACLLLYSILVANWLYYDERRLFFILILLSLPHLNYCKDLAIRWGLRKWVNK